MQRAIDERGWCATPGPIVEPEVIAAAHDAAVAICRGEHATGVAPQSDVGDGVTALRKIDQAWWADDRIAAVSLHPRLGEIAAELLGVNAVHLWHDQRYGSRPFRRPTAWSPGIRTAATGPQSTAPR